MEKKPTHSSLTSRITTMIAVVGILLTIIGWYLKQAERYPRVVQLMAPAYPRSLNAYEKMLKSADVPGPSLAEITNQESGFREILSILMDQVSELKHQSNVLKIKISGTGLAIGSYNPTTAVYYSGVMPSFELTLADGTKFKTQMIPDLRPEIRKRFLDDVIFYWGGLAFWLGIVLSVSSLIIPLFSS